MRKSDISLFLKNVELLDFMKKHADVLVSIPEFKYEDIPYNQKALFRLPSFDYLLLTFNKVPL